MAYTACTITKHGGRREKPLIVLFETTGPGNVPRLASSTAIEKLSGRLKDLRILMKPVSAVSNAIWEALLTANRPDEIEVEFGVEIGAEAGLPLITTGSAKAHFTIKLNWKNAKEARPDGIEISE